MVVLNFHGVGPITRKIDEGELDCWIETDFLKRVLDLSLKREGIALTVDDGNQSDVRYILPELVSRRLKATFFLCTGKIGQDTYLDSDDVKELISHGMRIGNHGRDHRPWFHMSREDYNSEVVCSRQDLEQRFSVDVTEAACPFGAYDRQALKTLKRARYAKVYTSDMGCTSKNAWLSPRNTVRRSMNLDQIQQILDRRPPYGSSFKRTVKMFLKGLR